MAMPNLNVQGNYRYGYQGQEVDPETGKPAFELRLYDPRINRWLTTDPANQYHSPYLSMGNNWINRVDPDGGYDGVYDYNVQTGESTKTSNAGDDIGQHTINYTNNAGDNLGSRTLSGFTPGALSFGQVANGNDLVYNALYNDAITLANIKDYNKTTATGGIYDSAVASGTHDMQGGALSIIAVATAPIAIAEGLSLLGSTGFGNTVATGLETNGLRYSLGQSFGRPVTIIKNSFGRFVSGSGRSLASNISERIGTYGLDAFGRASSFTPSVVPNWPTLAKGAIAIGGSAAVIYGGYKALITKATNRIGF